MSFAAKKFFLVAVAAFSLSTSACVGPALYTNLAGPLQAMEKKIGPKHGKACSKNYLGLVALGDGGIAAAAKQGGIREVTSVDFHFTSILGLYQENCTLVTGM